METELSPIDIAKGEALALAHELLARKGSKLSDTKCLEATAIACGFSGWNGMVARCKLGMTFDEVMVTEERAELLARHLVERRGVDVTATECAEILRHVESMVAGLVADMLSAGDSSQKPPAGLQPLEDN